MSRVCWLGVSRVTQWSHRIEKAQRKDPDKIHSPLINNPFNRVRNLRPDVARVLRGSWNAIIKCDKWPSEQETPPQNRSGPETTGNARKILGPDMNSLKE